MTSFAMTDGMIMILLSSHSRTQWGQLGENLGEVKAYVTSSPRRSVGRDNNRSIGPYPAQYSISNEIKKKYKIVEHWAFYDPTALLYLLQKEVIAMKKESKNIALEKKKLLQELIDDGCNTSSKLLAKLCEKRKISARESIRFLELSFEEQVEAYMEYCLNSSF